MAEEPSIEINALLLALLSSRVSIPSTDSIDAVDLQTQNLRLIRKRISQTGEPVTNQHLCMVSWQSKTPLKELNLTLGLQPHTCAWIAAMWLEKIPALNISRKESIVSATYECQMDHCAWSIYHNVSSGSRNLLIKKKSPIPDKLFLSTIVPCVACKMLNPTWWKTYEINA